MNRLRTLTALLAAASAMAFAQDPQSGGWRRVGTSGPPEEAAPPVSAQAPSASGTADAYGQIQSRSDRPLADRQAAPPQSAQAPAYGLPPQLTVPAGTFVTVRVNQALSSDRNQEGDIFNGSLMQPIVVDGVVVAQRGQNVMGRIAEATRAGRAHGTSRLALELTGITLADGTQANVRSQVVNRSGQKDVGRDVGTVATTTAVGAAIGAVADYGRGAAIGAGAGAAAGVIGVLLTRGHPTEVYPETVLTFRIDSPVAVNIAHAPQAFRYVGPDEYDRPVETHLAQRPAPRPHGGYYGGGYGGGYYGPYYGSWGYPYSYFWGPSFGISIRGGGHYRRFR